MILTKALLIAILFVAPDVYSGGPSAHTSHSVASLAEGMHGRLFARYGLLRLTPATAQAGSAPERSERPPWAAYLRGGGWIALGSILLIVPFYVLFLVRKRQLESKRLRILEDQLTFLFHHAPCGYHSVDEHGVLTNINQTLLNWLGYTREEVIGKMRFTQLVEEGDAAGGKAERLSPTVASVSLNLVTKGGQKFPVVLRSSGADHTGRLFSTTDNSACAEALDRINSLDQELESFSYSISHDLRAPLRSIDGYSKILQEDFGHHLGDEGSRVLNVIMSNAKRMGNLIDDLLEFGRLGRKNLQRSHIDMTAMAREIAQALLRQSPGRSVDVTIAGLHDASADAEMIRMVWFNLLDNAFKYSGKKREARIEVRSYEVGQDEWCYEVRDNGVGFDMKYAPKLFGVFQRLHKIQDFTGTGVGLAIVKRVISRHGGRVWAEGSLDGGATFYFTIPKHENT